MPVFMFLCGIVTGFLAGVVLFLSMMIYQYAKDQEKEKEKEKEEGEEQWTER